MFVNKLNWLYAGLAIIFIWTTGFIAGNIHGTSSQKLEFANASHNTATVNSKLAAGAGVAVATIQPKIEYKIKTVKEYIHVKENSDIDVNINNYWVHILDSSAMPIESSESTINFNVSTESTPISRITTVEAENLLNCQYDKRRLAELQNLLIAQGIEIQ